MRKATKGFTLVELLVVIIIIGLLSTIGYVIYAGVQKDSRNSQRAAKMTVVSTALEKYFDENGEYPSCSDMSSDQAGEILGIDQSNFVAPSDTDANSFNDDCAGFDDEISYDEFAYDGEGCDSDSCLEYDLEYYEEGEEESLVDIPSDEIMTPEEVGENVVCPVGFVPIPGSKTYNTTSFCVMKYEAKFSNDKDSKALSVAKGYPLWNSWGPGIPLVKSQDKAIEYAKTACVGCRLISEAEWMTIAQNVVQNDNNWTNDGNLFAGNYWNDRIQDASTDDSEGWYGIRTDRGDITELRRTFTIDNGTDDNNVIWDLSGNLPEWTGGSGYLSYFVDTDGNDLSGYASITWDNIELSGQNKLTVNPLPVFGVPDAKDWDGVRNVGNLNIQSGYNSNGRYFVRGGRAIYDLTMADMSTYTADTGFRATTK